MNVYKILSYIILHISIYSYIKFFNIGTGTDIQMYYFIFGLLYLILSVFNKKININLFNSISYISLILVISFILGIENNIFSIIRGNFGYISFFIMFNVFYKIILNIKLKNVEQILKKNFFIWFIISIIQTIDNSFFTFWRNRSTIGGGRGAISFATEPAYFALTMILISICLFLINRRNRKYMIYTFIISLLIAKSSVGVLYCIMIIIILYWSDIKKRKYTYSIIGVILLSLSITYIKNINPNTRMAYILQKTVNNPLQTIQKDGSLRVRVVHLLFPIIKIKESILIPNGVTNFTKDLKNSFHEVDFLYPKNFKNSSRNNNQFENKIVTFHGAIIYELGFLGIYIYYFIYKKLNNKKIFCIIMILGLNGLNITSPLLSLLIVIPYFKKKFKRDAIKSKLKKERGGNCEDSDSRNGICGVI